MVLLPSEGKESRLGGDVDLPPLGIAVGMGGGLATSAETMTVDDDLEDAREWRRLRAAGMCDGLMVMTSKSSS